MIDVEEHIYEDDPSSGHWDVRTHLKDVSYFFLGNGRIQAAVQIAPGGEGTAVGLLVMNPQKLRKKREALTLDETSGLESTRLGIRTDTQVYFAGETNLQANWSFRRGLPSAVVSWWAGQFEIQEEFFCPHSSRPILARVIRVKNRKDKPVKLTLETGTPFKTLSRGCELPPAAVAEFIVGYLLEADEDRVALDFITSDDITAEAAGIWEKTTQIKFDDRLLDRFFAAARSQLPAVISSQGVVDASIWQYNREWVRDHSWMALGLVHSGQNRLARLVLERLLNDFVTNEGDTIDSSEKRQPDEVELDQNGELLYVLDHYLRWTGDRELIVRYWDRIEALAEFPLQVIFRHEPSGLLTNVREYWERHHAHGIKKGMELAYQLFVSVGLNSAAAMAEVLGKPIHRDRWQKEAARLSQALLKDERYGLVHEERFIKRRGVDGAVHSLIQPQNEAGLPKGSPLASAGEHFLEPDTSEALPLALEFIPAESALGRNTLIHLEQLWGQNWEGGGYGRYHCSSEPDTDGPWPFPSLFVARAYAEAKDFDKVWRILRWMDSLSGSRSGSWFEFYGVPHSPPFAQLGVPPWTWSEMLCLLIHHILGVRPLHHGLHIRPHLFPTIKKVEAGFPLRQGWLQLRIQRHLKDGPARFHSNARILRSSSDDVLLDYSTPNIEVDIDLPLMRGE